MKPGSRPWGKVSGHGAKSDRTEDVRKDERKAGDSIASLVGEVVLYLELLS